MTTLKSCQQAFWFWMVLVSVYVLADAQKTVDLSDDLRVRYDGLIAELRCPKCLNINIADSDAPIAKDLRVLVASQLQDGKTDEQIKAFLYERYGDFILYDPPINERTALLWLIPLVLLVSAVVLIARLRTRRQKVHLSDEQKQQLSSLKNRFKS